MSGPLHLFEATGIELEYMIVDSDDLSVRPIADELLRSVGGSYAVDVELGPVAWSNELGLHVIEIKTNGPVASLAAAVPALQQHVDRIRDLLRPLGARLLPTAMHPWMDPLAELRLWNHENDVIYETFDRIFDCRGHGWANLQSMHINLPFADDDEFGRLHAAIRLVLPLLPALAASSPFMDGRRGPALDNRLQAYRDNARRVPSVSGLVIPEPVFTRDAYEGRLLQGIYDDMASLDPEGVLRHEWVNARGAIARFDRMAIEIRVLDVQECPGADLAIAALVIAAVRELVEEVHCDLRIQQAWDTRALADLLGATIVDAEATALHDGAYLRAFGLSETAGATAGAVWRCIWERWRHRDPDAEGWTPALEHILGHGCLARRIVGAVEPSPTRAALQRVYRALAGCLDAGTLFGADAA